MSRTSAPLAALLCAAAIAGLASTAMASTTPDGKAVYEKSCSSCHQATGEGLAGARSRRSQRTSSSPATRPNCSTSCCTARTESPRSTARPTTAPCRAWKGQLTNAGDRGRPHLRPLVVGQLRGQEGHREPGPGGGQVGRRFRLASRLTAMVALKPHPRLGTHAQPPLSSSFAGILAATLAGCGGVQTASSVPMTGNGVSASSLARSSATELTIDGTETSGSTSRGKAP